MAATNFLSCSAALVTCVFSTYGPTIWEGEYISKYNELTSSKSLDFITSSPTPMTWEASFFSACNRAASCDMFASCWIMTLADSFRVSLSAVTSFFLPASMAFWNFWATPLKIPPHSQAEETEFSKSNIHYYFSASYHKCT